MVLGRVWRVPWYRWFTVELSSQFLLELQIHSVLGIQTHNNNAKFSHTRSCYILDLLSNWSNVAKISVSPWQWRCHSFVNNFLDPCTILGEVIKSRKKPGYDLLPQVWSGFVVNNAIYLHHFPNTKRTRDCLAYEWGRTHTGTNNPDVAQQLLMSFSAACSTIAR